MMPGPSVRDLTSDEDRRRRILLGEGAPEQKSAEDISWAVHHAMGYGSVDAPSPFGHNRDQFNAEHPGYSGGYYNAGSGFYDAPDEAPPGWINTEPQRVGGNTPSSTPMSHDLSGLPSGGNSESGRPMSGLPSGGDTSTPADWGVMSPESSGSMPGAAQQENSSPQSSEPTMGQLMEMISNYVENSQTSNGT